MDDFIQEELLEKRELYKGIHKPLKSWYSNTSEVIRNKYGEIPQFWQDLEQWQHTKNLIKLYLTIEERKNTGASDEEIEKSLFAIDNKQSVKVEETIATDNSSAVEIPATSSADTTTVRKRRSRWEASTVESSSETTLVESSSMNNSDGTSTTPAVLESEQIKKPKKSRFAPAASNNILASKTAEELAILSQETTQQILILKMKLQHLNDKLMTVIIDAHRIELDPNRSPSPPPKYDSNGKRTNTRELRMRDELMKERSKVIEELLSLNPAFVPPPDYVRTKPFRKLYIPIKQFPSYNFIGLIIGPRGNTQKKMEQETGTKISIRGKGSFKDGTLKRNQLTSTNPNVAKSTEDDDDELHVHIQGETEANVEAAAKLVSEILTPVDDLLNEHKQKQLKELALINGTFKEDEYCPICGEKGHRQFECMNRTKSFKAANVKCSICGDLSHPTRDCPLQNQNINASEVSLDKEYDSFMAELDGKKPKSSNSEVIVVTNNEFINNNFTPGVSLTPNFVPASSIQPINFIPATVITNTVNPEANDANFALPLQDSYLAGGNSMDAMSQDKSQPTIIQAPTIPQRLATGNQQTIVMPAIDMSKIMYPQMPAGMQQFVPPGMVQPQMMWNGLGYVPMNMPPQQFNPHQQMMMNQGYFQNPNQFQNPNDMYQPQQQYAGGFNPNMYNPNLPPMQYQQPPQ